MITLIIRVIDFRVEQLHDKGNAMLLGKRNERSEASGAVADAVLLTDAISVTGKTNDLFNTEGGCGGDELLVDLVQGRVNDGLLNPFSISPMSFSSGCAAVMEHSMPRLCTVGISSSLSKSMPVMPY